jgi:pyrimidine-nucleoside phosphorylase
MGLDMDTVRTIEKKRDGGALDRAEIEGWIAGVVDGSIPAYQSTALLMAIRLRGMNDEETAVLTEAMARSGAMLTPEELGGFTVDKHSTGGVGDTTTLVLIPLLAAAGLTIGKLSGRALGHTGGTIDKLESIPGFRTKLSREAFVDQVRRIGFALADHTDDMVPADRILYELRDVTATVDSLPLIVASIMSKKIAGGAQAIVIDVKTGSGAFLPEIDASRRLARSLVSIGSRLGRKMAALITDMSQPLGRMVGNSLEVCEAIDTCRGRGPQDLADLCCELGAELLLLSGKENERSAAIMRLRRLLLDGSAFAKLQELVREQGGNTAALEDLSLLPRASRQVDVSARVSGTVAALEALAVGRAAHLLGAGRRTAEDAIDPAVGVELRKKVGERVAKGEAVAVLHVNAEENLDEAHALVEGAYALDKTGAAHEPPPLVVERIRDA